MMKDGNLNCSDIFVIYRRVESLCCMPGSNIMLQVNYNSKANKLIEKEIRFVVTKDQKVRGRGYWMKVARWYKLTAVTMY